MQYLHTRHHEHTDCIIILAKSAVQTKMMPSGKDMGHPVIC